MFGSIGMPELIVILVIALVVFGPRRLPEIGRSLGRTINEFKRASSSLQQTWEQEVAEERRQRPAADPPGAGGQPVAGQASGSGVPSPSEFSEQLSRSASGELG